MESTGRYWLLPVLAAVVAVLGHARTPIREYCETEAFNATCDQDEIILLTHAKYGRMRVGRCVKLDYGHVGCSSDVLHLADTKCSGRRACQLRIPDALFAKTKPCPDDLKPYLEATYDCVKVATPTEERCHLKHHRTLTAQKGYLSSLVTQESGCGTASLPWRIHVKPGQKINISLYDFAMAAENKYSSSGVNQCKVYAVIREKMVNRIRNITVCGALSRERNVYLSMTNILEIGLVTSELSETSPMFIVGYRATGCPDIVAPPSGSVMRTNDNVVISCNHTKESWHLKCVDSQWLGDRGNCTHIPSLKTTRSPSTDHPLSYGSSILIIIAVALTIGLAVLIVGLCCLKRRRHIMSYIRRCINKRGVHTATLPYFIQRHRLCGMSDTASADSSDFSEDKTYSTHYQWTKKPEHVSPSKDPGLGSVRVDNPADLYDFAHHIHHNHETQPCTPLLNKQRANTIYGQAVRCTCPHVQPTYVRASDLRPPTNANPLPRPPNPSLERDSIVGGATSRVGSHYFVLDPDVIADQRTHPVQLRTFGPPKASSQADREEIYPMCTIKHPVAPSEATDKTPSANCNCRPAPSQLCPHAQPPAHAQEALLPGASHEDLDNNENERRKPETVN